MNKVRFGSRQNAFLTLNPFIPKLFFFNKISIKKHQMKFIDHSMKFGLILLIIN
jgi:hypothetical protein